MSAFSVVEGDDCRARTKETAATLKSVTGAAESGGRGELVDAVARELAGELRRRKRPIARFRPQRATAGVEILDELREVNRTVFGKAAPDEAAASLGELMHSPPASPSRPGSSRSTRPRRPVDGRLWRMVAERTGTTARRP